MENKKVIRFERDADYYFAKYMKAIERGSLLDALTYIRSAIAKDPEDYSMQFCMAEIYTEMNMFEESSIIIYDLMSKGFLENGDCLYCLGCNFIGLNEPERAKDFFEKYLDIFPNGEFIYDAEEFIWMLENEWGGEPAEEEQAPRHVRLYQEGEPLDDEYERNNQALELFCQGKQEEALRMTEEILRVSPKNVHAVTNMILFGAATGNRQRVEQYAQNIDQLVPAGMDEKKKLILALCEVGHYQRAYEIAMDALQELPYDARLLNLAAACCANTGRSQEAADFLLDVIRLEPENTIAQYYRGVVEKAAEAGQPVRIQNIFQVPIEEVQRRLAFLDSTILGSDEEIMERWRQDDVFANTLMWAMTLSNEVIKASVVSILGKCGGERAERCLKWVLLEREESDQLKKEISIVLGRMGVRQPFLAYVDGTYADVRIGGVEDYNMPLAQSNKRVMERISALCEEIGLMNMEEQARAVLVTYIFSCKKPPIMRNIDGWAAAAIICGAIFAGDSVREILARVTRAAQAGRRSIQRFIRQIIVALDEKEVLDVVDDLSRNWDERDE